MSFWSGITQRELRALRDLYEMERKAKEMTVKVDGADVCTWYYTDGTMSKSHIDDVVSESMACPSCGECRLDWLVCGDDERDDVVACGTCGYIYEMIAGAANA